MHICFKSCDADPGLMQAASLLTWVSRAEIRGETARFNTRALPSWKIHGKTVALTNKRELRRIISLKFSWPAAAHSFLVKRLELDSTRRARLTSSTLGKAHAFRRSFRGRKKQFACRTASKKSSTLCTGPYPHPNHLLSPLISPRFGAA